MAQTLQDTLGAQVRRYRTERNLTQTELAEAADLSLDMISRLERGKIGVSLKTIASLSDVLEVPVAVLFGGSSLHSERRGEREDALLAIHQILADVDTKDLPWVADVIRNVLKR